MAIRRCKGKTRAGARCTRRGVEWCAQHAAQAGSEDHERTIKKARARKADDWRPRFLAAFEEYMSIRRACLAAEVTRSNVYAERKRDEAFAAAWAEIEESTTEEMEREAYRRAVDGWIEREEFAADGEGNQVLTLRVRKWSDNLLMFMLKARRPDVYREQHKIEVSGLDGAPIAAEISTVTPKEAADAAHDFLTRIAGPGA